MARRLRSERGFTLVELLVGMMAGMVVATGLFTILDVSLRQTTRTFSRIDATQRARATLDRVENEMHSACLENDTVPIETGSTANQVNFWTQYGRGVNLTPTLHKIFFTPPSGGTGGTLTDAVYPLAGNSGTSPSTWLASGTATSSETLLTNVAQSGSTPVFRYYRSTTGGQVEVTPGSGGLLNDNTDNSVTGITQVTIALVVKPAGGSNENADLVPNTVTNSVLLRLTPVPNPGSSLQDFAPCQ